MTQLPQPSFEAIAHSQSLIALIKTQIDNNKGWLSFRDVMDLALYTPELGYYTAGMQKFGAGGDFVTAPEISPMFAQTLANQTMQVLQTTGGSILELGAGTGKLARDSLLALAEQDCLPDWYFILEVSSHLRAVQQETLAALPETLLNRIMWLDALPTDFTGVIVGNEVLDALPVHLVGRENGAIFERGVTVADDQLTWKDQPIGDDRADLLSAVEVLALPDHYLTEICLEASALINSLCDCLSAGAIIMVDYGFDVSTYYHPQRNEGTLMCHFQQYAHSDPLINVGLQDITAHVNFTQIAQAGFDQSLRVAGYTTQMQFLMNCGILQMMEKIDPEDVANYAPMASGVQKLLSPTEMGELFKVIMLTTGFDAPCLGFVQGDKTHTL